MPPASPRTTLTTLAALAMLVLAPVGAAASPTSIGPPAPTRPPAVVPRVAAGSSATTAATLPDLPTPFSTALGARRWEVQSFRPVLEDALDEVRPWNGSTSRCVAGTRSTAEQQAVVDVVNLYRRAAGVPPLGPPYAAAATMAQDASLIMEAQGALSHTPPTSWACWSSSGRAGAERSNLALGFDAVSQVPAYMDDFGDGNQRVGHRQWLLSPELAQVGVGGTGHAAAIVVSGVPTTGTTTPRAIAFPSAGYAPTSQIHPRWSLSFHNVDVDLSDASVTVRREGRVIGTRDHTDLPASTPDALDYAHTGPGDGRFGGLATISWELTDEAALTRDLAPGPGSTTYTVRVTGIVVGGVGRSYSYDVEITPDRFADDDGHLFEADAIQLAAAGVTRGCGDGTRYCPDDAIPREQIAAFFVRALRLPPATTDHFDDDDGTRFESDINRLAEAGITRGCGPAERRTFCPTETVTRGQMAAFFTRALKLGPASKDWFVDDRGSIFEDAINRLATSGITRGCGGAGSTTFCPDDDVTRGQMAAFFVRADLAD